MIPCVIFNAWQTFESPCDLPIKLINDVGILIFKRIKNTMTVRGIKSCLFDYFCIYFVTYTTNMF